MSPPTLDPAPNAQLSLSLFEQYLTLDGVLGKLFVFLQFHLPSFFVPKTHRLAFGAREGPLPFLQTRDGAGFSFFLPLTPPLQLTLTLTKRDNLRYLGRPTPGTPLRLSRRSVGRFVSASTLLSNVGLAARP